MGEFVRYRRVWSTKEKGSPMSCYLAVEGRVTVAEVIEHFKETYPEVDPLGVDLNFTTAHWEEPATPEDLAERERREAWHQERLEKWERETYERLKKKFR